MACGILVTLLSASASSGTPAPPRPNYLRLCENTAAKPCEVSHVRNPLSTGDHLSDATGILDNATTSDLTSELVELERNVSIARNASGCNGVDEVLLVIIDRSPEDCVVEWLCPIAQTPVAFARRLFHNFWQCETCADKTNILVVVYLELRRVEIVAGPPLKDTFTADWCTSMLMQRVVPHFKAGRYADGLRACVSQIGARLQALRAAESCQPDLYRDLLYWCGRALKGLVEFMGVFLLLGFFGALCNCDQRSSGGSSSDYYSYSGGDGGGHGGGDCGGGGAHF